ncbi:transcriptional regulator SlyA [Xenorhabdus vietnamensis]|uniref:Transcriptional regulator SlyA n=1 Tax=Xenorhabdus vietnamensis TaxID=351656 RepID=A0A1Y2SKT1_9GAMM|nr:homoprotocatechuate degradation operon regulator HpaR [Xenorhabdus vietnamensis]OTA18505.1 transcriptional regulator SlyA [Xenorhabdus vietnamensis]
MPHQYSLTTSLRQARETAMGFLRPAFTQYGLTEQKWHIIYVLAHRRSVDFHELASLTCILRPSLTGILIRMDREGFIHRLKPMNDQRKLCIVLTQKGMDCYEQVKGLVEEGYKEIEDAFTSDKLIQLLNLLNEFTSIRSNRQDDLEEKTI